MKKIKMDLRTEIALLKDQMNVLINTAIEEVTSLRETTYSNPGMGYGFDSDDNKSPSQIKREVIHILNGLRPKVGK